MALSDMELRDIISRLSADEQKQLFNQLKTQFAEPPPQTEIPPQQSTIRKQNSVHDYPQENISGCIYCGSSQIKSHGFTSKGTRRFLCKSCKKSFTENHGAALKGTHLSKSEWIQILTGLVHNLSLSKIAVDIDRSVPTVWLCRQKVCKAIADYYGYSDLFHGTTQADEYYLRACFKGKRDPEFFIFTLHRMPRHHRTYAERVAYLINNNLYDRLLAEDPDYLEFLLSGEDKKKRGVSNDQICVLTLVDESNHLYLEPVSVGRLERAMAKTKLKPRFDREHRTVMVTDALAAYDRATYGTGVRHETIPSGKHTVKKYNLAKVNSVHSLLSQYMDQQAGRVYTTKYLDINLMLFWWLYKFRDSKTEEKVEMLYHILTDDISDTETRERVNQTTKKDLTERIISIDTKGKFPNKI